jgi:predicted PurR-regulated permease PerM
LFARKRNWFAEGLPQVELVDRHEQDDDDRRSENDGRNSKCGADRHDSQYAPFLALLTGLLEAIPVVGPVAAAVIAGVSALQHATGFGLIVGYAIYLAVLRLSIDQLFGPLALGAAARVHPVLIIFCFLSGGALFGVVGVIMAVPVALVAKVTLATLYDETHGPPRDDAQRKQAR